ncbi:MAG: isoprenylcysteine carboxylmethyltransferase family protein [Gammaproteobacteria bacterium]|nr:isoprenylcysteine carboxylmethyltransferase family protein [Gammaproteobacteria bacterium]MDH5731486.1 isoprenylcysteine carboxylmethyltransferase family protein [Gammaproteobacteria bacterium]
MKAFESKIPPPIVALLFAILIWWMAGNLPTTEIDNALKLFVVGLLVTTGLLFDLFGLINFRKARTTVNPVKLDATSALVSTGIYKISRNPMYVGLTFFLTAWCIYLSSLIAILGVTGFVLYIHIFQILPEERMLSKLFGDEYKKYQSRVRRWL